MHLQHPSAVVCTSPRLFRRRNCGAMETSGIKGRTLARRIDRRAIFNESEVNDRVNRNLITETTEKRQCQCVPLPSVPALRIARLSKFGERASQPPSSFSLSLSLSLSSSSSLFCFLSFSPLLPRDIRNKYNAWDYGRVLLAEDDQIYCTVPLAICRHRVYTLYACTFEKMKPALPRGAFISWRYPRYEKAGMPDNAAAMHAHPPSLPASRLE